MREMYHCRKCYTSITTGRYSVVILDESENRFEVLINASHMRSSCKIKSWNHEVDL